jgi:2,4-dienoyl-CoA reductase-like NADH-dependent reductase (Old Yellow Enzyme family)
MRLQHHAQPDKDMNMNQGDQLSADNSLNQPLQFKSGHSMKNRFMLAPLTNSQSHADGRLSEEEFHWLTKRAKGQFGLTMTCAAHVQAIGQGFPGQLGIFGEQHLAGHERLAQAIKAEGSIAVLQLHHAGMRAPADLIGEAPVCASAHAETGARAMTIEEVRQLRDDFIASAVRSQQAGYDGVEIHGAHGYVVCQFLSSETNQREDEYGGSLANRQRLLIEIAAGIRSQCGSDFLLGVRLSPERFGMQLQEALDTCQLLIDQDLTDFLDISLWDSFKLPVEEDCQHQSLLAHFAQLDLQDVKLTVAGKIRTAQECASVMAADVDFVTIGRAAILHHDFPLKVLEDPAFEPVPTPVSREHLQAEGLSPVFINYMNSWKGFVAQD